MKPNRSLSRCDFCPAVVRGILLLALAVVNSLADSPAPRRPKHLFVDEGEVAQRQNLERVLHHPTPHPDGPVLVGDQPWERWNIGVNGRCLLFDEARQVFQMWYGVYYDDATLPTGTAYRVCYAESKDGVHWSRPALGQSAWGARPDTNLLAVGEVWMRRPNIVRDDRDPDPARRYKMTYVDIFDGQLGIAKGYSADGLKWTLNADRKPWFRGWNHSSNLMGWDESIGAFVFFTRITAGEVMSVGRSTSPDLIQWTAPEVILQPSASEPTLAFKGNAAFFYEGNYLGFLWVFDRAGDRGRKAQGKSSSPTQVADVELVSSRDGVRWQRPFPREFFQPRGTAGAWDAEGITPVAPIVHRDQIWIYYSGWNYPYGTSSLGRVKAGWIEQGVRQQGAVGLATLRLDGFVSLRAGSTTGTITTTPLEPHGILTVNAIIRGELKAAVLDADGNSLAGFGLEECEPLQGDSLRQVVRWRGNRTTADLPAGRTVQFKFTLREGDLFAYWFVPGSSRPSSSP